MGRKKLVVLLDDNEVVHHLDSNLLAFIDVKPLLSSRNIEHFKIELSKNTNHDVLLVGCNPEYFKQGSEFSTVFDACLNLWDKKLVLPPHSTGRCFQGLPQDTSVVIIDNSPDAPKSSVDIKRNLLNKLLGTKKANTHYIQYQKSLMKARLQIEEHLGHNSLSL